MEVEGHEFVKISKGDMKGNRKKKWKEIMGTGIEIMKGDAEDKVDGEMFKYWTERG